MSLFILPHITLVVEVKLNESEYVVFENDSQVGMRINHKSEDCFTELFILETLPIDIECKL